MLRHHRRSGKRWIAAFVAIGLAGAAETAWAQYYIGPSFIRIPGIEGASRDAQHVRWIKAESHYWTEKPTRREIRGISGKETSLQFTGSRAPKEGANMLAIAIDKRSAALPALLERCRSGATTDELTFSESSELARHPQEHGPRPAEVPEFYQYLLKNVRMTCPIVEKAPEQAFGLHFQEIVWLNSTPLPRPRPITAEPARLPAAPRSGGAKVFAISWFAPISDSRDDQCPRMNTKPSQADYYALMSPERAAERKAFLADKGGASTAHLPYRGPDEMNVTVMPGIVPDPGFFEPQVDAVRGFDLDGDDGTGPPPAHTRKHKNFTSPDGRKGIDNQLFVVQGCVEGWRRRGFLPMIGNEGRRAGGLTILVEVSGIDDERNDNDVAVTIYYSTDPLRRDRTSKIMLPDYTYRVSAATEHSQDYARFRGKILNGVVMTEPIEKITMHEGPASTWPMFKPRLRIEFNPDGTMTGTLGGYRDWRQYLAMAFFQSSDYENTIGFQTPAMYFATRRAADGLQDPVTGEFNGISAAYELEGIPAFIPPSQSRRLLAGGRFSKTKE